MAGDFDNDGDVDADDQVQWKGDFGVNGDSDANGDGYSDGADFLVWQRNLGATSIATVPEPASFVLAGGMALAMLGQSRRDTAPRRNA